MKKFICYLNLSPETFNKHLKVLLTEITETVHFIKPK